MKGSFRIATAVLCICMLLCSTSCANQTDDTPNGMKNATAAGADFRFYIPAYWNVSTEYGVSGGYYTQAGQSRASVVKYLLTEEQVIKKNEAVANGSSPITWFWETECLPALQSITADGGFTHLTDSDADVLLGTMNAKRYYCKLTTRADLELLHTVQVVAEANNAFYVLTCTLTDALYADRSSDIDQMIQYFKLADPFVPDAYAKATGDNAEAPDGMKQVSSDEVAYRFFVPVDWIVDRNDAIYAAYSEKDRSSVSVIPYQPSEGQMSIDGYFSLCEEQMQLTAGKDGYELISVQKDTVLGGRVAYTYEYTYTVGQETLRYRQVIATYKGMLYSVTYTSRPETFEDHLAEFDAILAAFTFR